MRSLYYFLNKPYQKIALNKDKILLEIDRLKTELIDNFEDNEVLTKDIFTSLFDNLFDLGKEIEQNDIPDKQLFQKFDEIKVKVKHILG